MFLEDLDHFLPFDFQKSRGRKGRVGLGNQSNDFMLITHLCMLRLLTDIVALYVRALLEFAIISDV